MASSIAQEMFASFVSHAGEDKQTIATRLAEWLRQHGVTTFLDRHSIWVGDDAPQVMIDAMKTARVGIFILSPEFVAKKWPMRELMCFIERATTAASQGLEPPLLIPVFYRLTVADCKSANVFSMCDDHGAPVFGKFGFFERAARGETSVQAVCTVLKELASRYKGVENEEGATNDDNPNMARTRERFIERVGREVLQKMGIPLPQAAPAGRTAVRN